MSGHQQSALLQSSHGVRGPREWHNRADILACHETQESCVCVAGLLSVCCHCGHLEVAATQSVVFPRWLSVFLGSLGATGWWRRLSDMGHAVTCNFMGAVLMRQLGWTGRVWIVIIEGYAVPE
jgi:hypothetical protein